MKNYVLIFTFNPDRDRVIMIKKTIKPAHHIGLLNGIGGKIEDGESPQDAAEREFEEETGMSRCGDIMDIFNFATMSGPEWNVECYFIIAEFDRNFTHDTHEGPVSAYDPSDCQEWRAVSNIGWLVPMALEAANTDECFRKAVISYFK